MDGETVMFLLAMCIGGVLTFAVSVAVGARLKHMRKQQFLDGWDEEWTE